MFKSTPHINVLNEAGFGKTVLMPGDPLRSKYIAENFLENAVLVNNVRGVQGYTGYYNGAKVSVMASGMGMPSIGIYSYELYSYFDVENIIRIGSAGAISEDVKVMDIVAGIGACTNSDFPSQYGLRGSVAPVASFELLARANELAKNSGIDLKIGNLLSSDTFYDDTANTLDWRKMNCLAVEMEACALYCTALRLKKKALAICTISDLVYPPFDSLTAEQRQTGFDKMVKLSLEIAENS